MLLGTAIILQLMMRMMGPDGTLFLLLAWPFSRGFPRPRRVIYAYARLRDIWLGYLLCDMSPFLIACFDGTRPRHSAPF